MTDLTPEQLAARVALTRHRFCNLKLVASRWYGLRVEQDRTWLYVGLTPGEPDAKFDRREPHEHLRDALKALDYID